MHRVRCPNCQSMLPADASGCAPCGADITGELLILEPGQGHGLRTGATDVAAYDPAAGHLT